MTPTDHLEASSISSMSIPTPLSRGLYRACVPIMLVWGLIAAGCSSGEYTTDFGTSLGEYRTAAEFSRLHATATPLAGGAVSVQVPRFFDSQLDGTEMPRRAVPPFLHDYPGFQIAFEKQFIVAGASLPAVLTVGVVPSNERKWGDIESAILEQVRADESFPEAEWNKQLHTTPEGKKWQVLDLNGMQIFERNVAGNSEQKRSEGTCEIWVSVEPKQAFCTVLAWRIPDELARQVPLAELAPLTVRTVIEVAQ